MKKTTNDALLQIVRRAQSHGLQSAADTNTQRDKEANDEALEASADQTLQRVNAHLNPRDLIFSGPRIKFEDE